MAIKEAAPEAIDDVRCRQVGTMVMIEGMGGVHMASTDVEVGGQLALVPVQPINGDSISHETKDRGVGPGDVYVGTARDGEGVVVVGTSGGNVGPTFVERGAFVDVGVPGHSISIVEDPEALHREPYGAQNTAGVSAAPRVGKEAGDKGGSGGDDGALWEPPVEGLSRRLVGGGLACPVTIRAACCGDDGQVDSRGVAGGIGGGGEEAGGGVDASAVGRTGSTFGQRGSSGDNGRGGG